MVQLRVQMRPHAILQTLRVVRRNASRYPKTAGTIDAADGDSGVLQSFQKETVRLVLEVHRENLDVDVVSSLEAEQGVDQLTFRSAGAQRADRGDQEWTRSRSRGRRYCVVEQCVKLSLESPIDHLERSFQSPESQTVQSPGRRSLPQQRQIGEQPVPAKSSRHTA